MSDKPLTSAPSGPAPPYTPGLAGYPPAQQPVGGQGQAAYAYPPQQGYPADGGYQGGYQQGYPPQGYPPQQQAYPPQGYPPQQSYSSNTTVVTTQSAAPPVVVVSGGCPVCKVGVMVDDYTCCGVALAIIFFPLGILCCLAMTKKRCNNCGASFS